MEGEIIIPAAVDKTRDLKLVISTCAIPLENDPCVNNETQNYHAHPNLLHQVIKSGKNREHEREAIPNESHWKLEFLIKNEKNDQNHVERYIYAVKKEGFDIVNIEDKLFHLDQDDRIHLGHQSKSLKVNIITPKNVKRAKPNEITTEKVLTNRIKNEAEMKFLLDKYIQNPISLKSVVLKVEIYNLEGNILLGSGVSGPIVDQQDPSVGSIDIKEVNPKVSCEKGGRKITLTTSQSAKNFIPVFQLYDPNGTRLHQLEVKLDVLLTLQACFKGMNRGAILLPYNLRSK